MTAAEPTLLPQRGPGLMKNHEGVGVTTVTSGGPDVPSARAGQHQWSIWAAASTKESTDRRWAAQSGHFGKVYSVSLTTHRLN